MKLQKDIWFNNYNYQPRTICELGTGGSTCVFQCENFLDLVNSKFILVEANPVSFEIIKSNFKDKNNVSIYNKAICDENKIIKYYNRDGKNTENASGFIEGVTSPLMVNHGYVLNEEHALEIEGIKFSEIDDGQIDILFCDIEGAEWYALKHMISDPKIICLETHSNNFVNENINKIENYINQKGYILVGRSESDSLYMKR